MDKNPIDINLIDYYGSYLIDYHNRDTTLLLLSFLHQLKILTVRWETIRIPSMRRLRDWRSNGGL